MIDDNQIYVVVDIEANGPVPGQYSMLSIGAVATTKEKETSEFYRKLKPLEGAKQSRGTMAWWQTQPEAWKEVTTDAEAPEKVMSDFVDWIEGLGMQPVFVAHPTGYDFAMVAWYLWKFPHVNPFTSQQGAPITLDLTSFIAGKFGTTIEQSKRTNLPEWMKTGMPEHSHNALDDARGFAVILRNVLREI